MRNAASTVALFTDAPNAAPSPHPDSRLLSPDGERAGVRGVRYTSTALKHLQLRLLFLNQPARCRRSQAYALRRRAS